MKEQSMYICETCGSAYIYKEDARLCEQMHGRLEDVILEKRYDPHYKYPLYLIVLDKETEQEVKYKFIGEG